MNRLFTISFILVIAFSGLIMIELATSQTILKPSIPEFTIDLAGPSFDIPPTYSFNSSTGLFYANDGYHIKYSTVNIVIKNQPFSNQTNFDYFYYNVRIKPHNYPDSYWHELFYAGVDGFPIQTQSGFTVIPISVEASQPNGGIIPIGETTDIQVEAMIGHIGRNNTMVPYPYPYVFFGEASGWSNTQTVTLPPKVPFSVSDNQPTPSPSVPELSWLTTLPLLLAIPIVLAVIRKRTRSRNSINKKNVRYFQEKLRSRNLDKLIVNKPIQERFY